MESIKSRFWIKNSNEEEDTHFLKMDIGFLDLTLKIHEKKGVGMKPQHRIS